MRGSGSFLRQSIRPDHTYAEGPATEEEHDNDTGHDASFTSRLDFYLATSYVGISLDLLK